MTRTLRAIDMSCKIPDSLMYPRKMCGNHFRVCDTAIARPRSAPLLWDPISSRCLILDRSPESSRKGHLTRSTEENFSSLPHLYALVCISEWKYSTRLRFSPLVQVQLVSPFLLQLNSVERTDRTQLDPDNIYGITRVVLTYQAVECTIHRRFHYLSWVCTNNRYSSIHTYTHAHVHILNRRNFWRMEFRFFLAIPRVARNFIRGRDRRDDSYESV